ncbi:SMP-30/gluconolactonase/LRE family protein [Dictyobacter formicarum]|uniref:Gluconolactonase n=1 Tax=Dictyobacter formicarum TaxID=2778368 RepID=A0ABQ3VST8_9CHLR|nr:SMP-30/gluconolactonase/LRE family protein [Dictyobacter formicarum]GHO88806.1 gluconolactonase [Dictyobacter formicarum]
MNSVEHILPCRNKLGEGPVWSVDEQLLYWVDIENDCYHRLDPLSDKHDVIPVGVSIGVLALRDAGGLVMATKKGFALWDEVERKLTYIARPFGENPDLRFNDGAVDCRGRFWAGTMADGDDVQARGALYRLDPDGSVHEMISDIGVSNGIGWSPDNRTMYFTDSPTYTIVAYDFDAETGNISNRRIFVETPAEEGDPDGLSVDSEGYVWSAYWNGSKVVRYDPQGQVDQVIQMPVPRPTAPAFGGQYLDELYITSAFPEEDQRETYPLSGDLFRVKVGIKGLAKYKFAG